MSTNTAHTIINKQLLIKRKIRQSHTRGTDSYRPLWRSILYQRNLLRIDTWLPLGVLQPRTASLDRSIDHVYHHTLQRPNYNKYNRTSIHTSTPGGMSTRSIDSTLVTNTHTTQARVTEAELKGFATIRDWSGRPAAFLAS